MDVQFASIETWPGLRTPAARRRASSFKANYSQTLELLYRELGCLKAQRVIIQVEVAPSQIRVDGHLRHDAKMRGPGVVLSMQTKHGPVTCPCDAFTHWHANLRAISLSLEALRAVDRYGVTSNGQQYRGWLRLPDPFDPAVFLAFDTPYRAEQVRADATVREAAYKIRAKQLHPDVGGNAEAMARLNEAIEMLRGAS